MDGMMNDDTKEPCIPTIPNRLQEWGEEEHESEKEETVKSVAYKNRLW